MRPMEIRGLELSRTPTHWRCSCALNEDCGIGRSDVLLLLVEHSCISTLDIYGDGVHGRSIWTRLLDATQLTVPVSRAFGAHKLRSAMSA